MSIYKIDPNQTLNNKIIALNDMIIELNGYIKSARFDKNELDQIFADGITDREFLRNQAIGSTVATYTGWTHVKAEAGYSIWKYSPTNYAYNSVNELYMNNKALENRGQASAETATAFDTVFLYNGDSGTGYAVHTTEAGTEEGTEFEVMDTTNDYLYLGLASTFAGAKFEFQTRGSNYTIKVEYYDSGTGWTELDSADNLEDGTNDFQSDGHISWTIPGTWTTTTINSVSRYWIRVSTTTDAVTTAKAYYIIPSKSVVGLLALSSSELLNEEWAWCSYSTAIYATIRNSGNTNYEGNYFITSASSAANLQNFFIYNNPFTCDYADTTYSP